jgi:hypothetical protein
MQQIVKFFLSTSRGPLKNNAEKTVALFRKFVSLTYAAFIMHENNRFTIQDTFLDDWTVFQGSACDTTAGLRGDIRTFQAFFNRRIDPGHLVFEYEARILPDAKSGAFSDLSCHLGSVRFCFGSAKNSFTGIRGPGHPIQTSNAPLIEPGKWHRVYVTVEDLECHMKVDGQDAGRLTLDEPLSDSALELYCWAGPCEFRIKNLHSSGYMGIIQGAPWIAEKDRLANMQQSIQWIEHRGKYLHECTLPGEGRDKGVYPAHPNGIQLSKDRFLVLYSTRSSRGDDDERSGIYQLRADGFDGLLLKEGWICRTQDDWDPLTDGKKYVRQHGHPTAFGVPKGALVNGRQQAHENLFAVIWRVEARWVDPDTGFMAYVQEKPELARTRVTEWMQFRLNDAGDDIEILMPPNRLRQSGYTHSPAFCQYENAESMVANFTQPVPYNSDASEWVHANTLYLPGPGTKTDHESLMVHTKGAVVPLRFRYEASTHRYQWVETGPPMGGLGQGLFEGSIVPYRGDWIMMARRVQEDAVAFSRVGDLFGNSIPMVLATDQPNRAPTVAYECPDGKLRRTGGINTLSPYQQDRNPIYIMDIDPDKSFKYTNPRVIFDACRAGVPIPIQPIVDFAKVLPHCGGKTQTILHRLRSPMLNDPRRPERKLTPQEIEVSGIYSAKIHYREEWPGYWKF